MSKQSQKVLRHSAKGTSERLRQVAIENRHPAGVKEPAFPISQEKIRAAIEAQLCPWCGRGPFKMLPVHTNKTHGVDKWELRDLAGFTTRDPLCSPESRAKMSASYNPARGIHARGAAAKKGKRPPRWTKEGIRRQTETILRWMAENPEAAAASQRNAGKAARLDPEGASAARRRAAIARWHAENPEASAAAQRKATEAATRWAAENPEAAAAAHRRAGKTRRRARRAANDDDVPA